MFGKKKPENPPAPPASSPPKQPSGDGDPPENPPPEGPPVPWAGWPDEIGCNFALGHLIQNLGAPLTRDGRIHAETMMCAVGAVAGACAQISLLNDPVAHKKAASQENGIVVVKTNDGREWLYGEAINHMLTSADPAIAPMRVWNNLAGGAIGAGLSPDDLPTLEQVFGHVSQALGGPMDGRSSVEMKHQPHLTVLDALKIVWPVAHDCLTGNISEICRKNGFAAADTSWAAVSAVAAGRLLVQVAEILPPKIALIIGIESAIWASKMMAPLKPQT
jgi:hypothetical protein